MSSEIFHCLGQDRHAAITCLSQLHDAPLSAFCTNASPREAMHAIADSLEQAPQGNAHAWVIRATAQRKEHADAPIHAERQHRYASAWPLWFRTAKAPLEKPLLYLTQSESVAGIRAALYESANRGIFCNDAQTDQPIWRKNRQTALPLWLSSHNEGTPYDPASGAETLSILRSALHSLYLEGTAGFFYFSAHAKPGSAQALNDTDAEHAFQGMYRIAKPQPHGPAIIKLLGAGQALAPAIHAAALLHKDWSIPAEVWSCPSYTRLARDGDAAEQWNMLHPLSEKRVSHLQRCLGNDRTPVVAVTGYAQHIANQVGRHIAARFVALGVDTPVLQDQTVSAQWIAFFALNALGAEGKIPMACAQDALERYALT